MPAVYTDTDIEVSHLVSCEICNNWYWSKKWNMFICPNCKEESRNRWIKYARQYNGAKYELAEESVRQGSLMFSIVVENNLHGIQPKTLRKIAVNRGYVSKNMKECLIHMERTGHLVWTDEFGNLRPYKNVNTGERYD